MEENKIDYGPIQIHRKVLEDLCLETIKEIDGVSIVRNSFWQNVLRLFGRRSFEGIRILIDKENQVNIHLKIIVQMGLNIPAVAQQVQNAVRQAIEKTAEIDLRDINVNIQRMERGKI